MREQDKEMRGSGLGLGDGRDVWADLTNEPRDLRIQLSIPTFQAFVLTEPQGLVKMQINTQGSQHSDPHLRGSLKLTSLVLTRI